MGSETCIRDRYPHDSAATINAANAAMKRKDFSLAEKYLANAGDSDEAVYARGILAFEKGDYDKAETILKPIFRMSEAVNLLSDIEAIRAREFKKFTRIELK